MQRAESAERAAGPDAPAQNGRRDDPGALWVSVVVPVRNGAERLRELIAALSAQTIPRDRFEVVIADDGSTDGATDSIAADDGRVRVVAGPSQNSYAARNRGAAAARAPILAFCDVDCSPEPTWLEAGIAALEHADVAAGTIRFRLPPRPTIWALLSVDMFLDQAREVRFGRAVSANLFMRRELFESVGPFDDTLPSGGDHNFVARSRSRGAQVSFAPRAIVWHPTFSARGLVARVWLSNRCAAYRAGRQRRWPQIASPALVAPPVLAIRARRSADRSLVLDQRPLRAAGLEPTAGEHVLALLVLYLILPWVAGAGQLTGWWAGGRSARRHRRTRLAAATRT